MQVLIKKLTRHLVMALAFFLSADRRVALERWLRGREEYRKLRLSDCVVVSFGKSGRTWLRVMMSGYFQAKHGLSKRNLIGFDNLNRKHADIPRVFFTHDNYLRDYTKNRSNKSDFYGKKVVLMVRDPRDTAVSQYFQWQHRMRPGKKSLNKYPEHGADITVQDFVQDRDAGLTKVIDFMNGWADEMANLEDILVVRYEDLRADPGAWLGNIISFLGGEPSAQDIASAVEFASIDNMRKMEQERVFWLSGSRMVPGDKSNPDSYKVRRAKVGGYRDYFTDAQAAELDAIVATELSPVFGYGKPASKDGASAA